MLSDMELYNNTGFPGVMLTDSSVSVTEVIVTEVIVTDVSMTEVADMNLLLQSGPLYTSYTERNILCILILVFIALSLSANGLLVKFIVADRGLHNPHMAAMALNAVTDMLYISLWYLQAFYTLVVGNTNHFSNYRLACFMDRITKTPILLGQCPCMGIMALERLLYFKHPFLHARMVTIKRLVILEACIYALSCIYVFLALTYGKSYYSVTYFGCSLFNNPWYFPLNCVLWYIPSGLLELAMTVVLTNMVLKIRRQIRHQIAPVDAEAGGSISNDAATQSTQAPASAPVESLAQSRSGDTIRSGKISQDKGEDKPNIRSPSNNRNEDERHFPEVTESSYHNPCLNSSDGFSSTREGGDMSVSGTRTTSLTKGGGTISSDTRIPYFTLGCGTIASDTRIPSLTVGGGTIPSDTRIPSITVGGGTIESDTRIPSLTVGGGTIASDARILSLTVGGGTITSDTRIPSLTVGGGTIASDTRVPSLTVGCGTIESDTRTPSLMVGGSAAMSDTTCSIDIKHMMETAIKVVGGISLTYWMFYIPSIISIFKTLDTISVFDMELNREPGYRYLIRMLIFFGIGGLSRALNPFFGFYFNAALRRKFINTFNRHPQT